MYKDTHARALQLPKNNWLMSYSMLQKQIMLNLKAVLEAADSSLESIVKANIYLTDLKNFNEVNEVYVSFFPGLKPASNPIIYDSLTL